ncbi:hypothetical protein MSM1_08875 [Mycobacterium sp. SM1]|uniref:hypothetical protein n=1 Tax=Mycobacterium sp. SM1 TaxID=2816243 RepID=UPI001BCC5B12|nr:hypothetical protein [Mycobacterium sp. SM1]MBS4728445.1 hypothetical protein [Mycobacterium sp. SM1]
MPDEESLPKTEPYTPAFDTGAWPQPPVPPDGGQPATPPARGEPPRPKHQKPEPAGTPAITPQEQWTPSAPMSPRFPSGPIPLPAQPVVVPGRYHYLKWWKLVLVLAGVWIAAAVIGLCLFYWWYHSIDKRPAVFAVLAYVVVCTVTGLMLAMVPDRPLLAALAIALMSAVFASVAAAAPLYGYYFCRHVSHCLVGVIPS